jgi:hypothetical protein
MPEATAATGPKFDTEAAALLRQGGWTTLHLPAGLTLKGLRAAGTPFKGPRYFDSQARDTREHTTVATALAYKPLLLPGSLNQPIAVVQEMLVALTAALPPTLIATLAPAAAYVWLCQRHYETTGNYPLARRYTLTADVYQERAPIVVGVFGQHNPLLVAPLVEGHGAGVGGWPVVLPRTVLPRLWPMAPPDPLEADG